MKILELSGQPSFPALSPQAEPYVQLGPLHISAGLEQTIATHPILTVATLGVLGLIAIEAYVHQVRQKRHSKPINK